MKRIVEGLAAFAVAFAALWGAACTSVPPNTAGTNTANTNAAGAAATPVAVAAPSPASTTSRASASNLPVTLPVLDAMFADEAFAGELKSQLQLTDEQVARLRTIAREETAGLREDRADQSSGSTREATSRAAAKIREVLGDEKAQAFTQFVSQRWEGGEAGGATLSTKPNSIPTDTRIVVNAPAYRMDVFENGQLVKTYKVGIGYPEFPLPQGLRKAQTIIFNPTWTPPDEPWVESSGKVKVGQKVEAGSKLNPLGPIKIPIGQPSLIHGGKNPAKLGTFASHGCVGLTSPQVQDFAVVLAHAAGAQLTPDDVKNYAAHPTETKSYKFDNAVPVELRYETIVVEDGRLHIYRDVYDKGTNTEENLRAVLAAWGVSPEQLTPEERQQVNAALDEMAHDAHGNPTNDAPSGAQGQTVNQNANKSAKESGNKNSNKSGQVTRTIKGRKEIVIDIAALRGKGYPAPVKLDTGGAPQQQPARSAGASRGKKA